MQLKRIANLEAIWGSPKEDIHTTEQFVWIVAAMLADAWCEADAESQMKVQNILKTQTWSRS